MIKQQSNYKVFVFQIFLAAFILVFIISYIMPVFMNGDIMKNYDPVPSMKPIGIDFSIMVEHSRSLLSGKTPYYESYAFPPLTSILFIPFVKMPHNVGYTIILFMILLSFLCIMFLIPKLCDSKDNITPSFLIITGFFSYGLRFELERGQFNLIAFFLCVLAMYIYHRTRYKKTSYLLFSLSVHLKIYPLLFIFAFTDRNKTIAENIKSLSLIAFINFILLFSLGPAILMDFFKSIFVYMGEPYVWVGNHSLKSFSVSRPFAFLSEHALLFIVALMFTACIIFCVSKNKSSINKYLITLAGICLLILPSSSHDYKLSLLPCIMCFYFVCNENEILNKSDKIFVFLISFLFCLTLFSYTNYEYWQLNPYFPFLLQNKFIILFLIYILVFFQSALNFFSSKKFTKSS